MHKVILLISTLLALTCSIIGANATSIGTLVEWCKPYANRGFEVKADEDVYCVTTLKAINESYVANCVWVKAAKEQGDAIHPALVQFLASGDAPINALIQSFLNWAEANPGKWNTTPSSYQFKWLSKEWPCDY